MSTALHNKNTRAALFLSVVIAVYVAAITASGALSSAERSQTIALVTTLDMVLLVPVAFFFLVVRPRGWPVGLVVPVVVLSLLAASAVLPDTHERSLGMLEAVAAPLEVAFIVWLFRRALKNARERTSHANGDVYENMRLGALGITGSELAASVVATEAAVLYYGLVSWFVRPPEPQPGIVFSHFRRGSHAFVISALLFVLAIEAIGVHLLVARLSVPAAWILTILTAYGGLWLIADYRATVLRPDLAAPYGLQLRAGLRYNVLIEWSDIVGVGSAPPNDSEKVSFVFGGEPSHWIELVRPLRVKGPYGIPKSARFIGVEPDEPAQFVEAILRRTNGST